MILDDVLRYACCLGSRISLLFLDVVFAISHARSFYRLLISSKAQIEEICLISRISVSDKVADTEHKCLYRGLILRIGVHSWLSILYRGYLYNHKSSQSQKPTPSSPHAPKTPAKTSPPADKPPQTHSSPHNTDPAQPHPHRRAHVQHHPSQNLQTTAPQQP